MSIDPHRLVYVPFEDAAKPCSGIAEIFIDHWWIAHPDRGLAFQTFPSRFRHFTGRARVSPVCNTDRLIAETFVGQFPEGHEIRLVEIAYFPVRHDNDDLILPDSAYQGEQGGTVHRNRDLSQVDEDDFR